MTFRFLLAALAVSLLLAPAAAAAPEDLDGVKELYASADFQ